MSGAGPSPTLYDAAVDLPRLTHLTTGPAAVTTVDNRMVGCQDAVR